MMQVQAATSAAREESDAALMQRIAAGDRLAYDVLVKRHLQRVYAIARGMVYRQQDARSEERRVGKSVDLGGRRIIKKKKKK